MTNPLKKKPRMNKKKIQPFIFVVKNKMYRTPIKTWKEQFMKPKTGRSNYMDWTYVTPMEQGVNMVPNYDTRQDPYADFKNYVDHVMSAPQGRKHRPKRKKSRKTRGFQPTTVQPQQVPVQQPVQQAPVAQPVQQPVEDDVEEEVVEDYQPIEQIQPIPQQVPVQAPPVVQQPQQPVQQAPVAQPQVQAPIQPVQPIPVQAPVPAPIPEVQPVQPVQQPAPAPIPEVQPQPVAVPEALVGEEAVPEEEEVPEQVPEQAPQQVVQPQVQTQGMFADGDYEYDTYTDSDA